MEIKILPLSPLFKMPVQAYPTDACFDVYATSREFLGDKRVKYGLGFAVEIPPGTRLDLRARSSVHKTGLSLSNDTGTIDHGFAGEVSAVFYHVSPMLPPYEVGDRIGQIKLEKVIPIEFKIVSELSETLRGENSYGSSGLK